MPNKVVTTIYTFSIKQRACVCVCVQAEYIKTMEWIRRDEDRGFVSVIMSGSTILSAGRNKAFFLRHNTFFYWIWDTHKRARVCCSEEDMYCITVSYIYPQQPLIGHLLDSRLLSPRPLTLHRYHHHLLLLPPSFHPLRQQCVTPLIFSAREAVMSQNPSYRE